MTPLEKGTCACGGDNPFKHHTEKTCWSDDLGVAHAPQPEGTCPTCNNTPTESLFGQNIRAAVKTIKEFRSPPQPEGIDEVTERIVIEYANLSGRESANRAEFRKRTRAHLMTMVKEFQNNVANNMEVGSDDWESFKEELRAEGAVLERRRFEEAAQSLKKKGNIGGPGINWNAALDALIAALRTSN